MKRAEEGEEKSCRSAPWREEREELQRERRRRDERKAEEMEGKKLRLFLFVQMREIKIHLGFQNLNMMDIYISK